MELKILMSTQDNKFEYSDTNKRYYTLDYYYKNKFKSKK